MISIYYVCGFLVLVNLCSMDSSINRHNGRTWNVLCWNVRGLNSEDKLTAIRSKISEANCDIICLQETKREIFDALYLRNFCPPQFDCFEFVPSVGASGGTIIIWNRTRFTGQVSFQHNFVMCVEFMSLFSGARWSLANVYAPCTPEARREFLQ